jgi:hypothetical protein
MAISTKLIAVAVVVGVSALSYSPVSAAPSKRMKRAVAAPVAPLFPNLFPGFKSFGLFSGQNAYASLPTQGTTTQSASVSTSCLPGELRAAIADVQSRFGPVTVVSTHRPGARIGGGHMSKHANCQAVDFRPAAGTYAAVANHLRQSWNGGLGTYSSGHIHIDTGPNYRWHTGGGRKRR